MLGLEVNIECTRMQLVQDIEICYYSLSTITNLLQLFN